MTVQLILCQVICLLFLTVKAIQNANSFKEWKTINHGEQWFMVALLTFFVDLILCHWTKYFAASLILSVGWGLPYFNILLNKLRDKPWNYLGEGKGAALTDLILNKVKNYLLLVYILWLGAGITIFYFLVK